MMTIDWDSPPLGFSTNAVLLSESFISTLSNLSERGTGLVISAFASDVEVAHVDAKDLFIPATALPSVRSFRFFEFPT